MATLVEELKLAIKAEVSDAVSKLKAFDRQVQTTQKTTENFGKSFGKEMVSELMRFAGPVGAAIAVKEGFQAIIKYGKEAVAEFENADAATKKLEAVIRATGGAAGLTASQMGDLADSLSKVTGVDDDSIKNLEAIMATFKSVTGENFKRAT